MDIQIANSFLSCALTKSVMNIFGLVKSAFLLTRWSCLNYCNYILFRSRSKVVTKWALGMQIFHCKICVKHFPNRQTILIKVRTSRKSDRKCRMVTGKLTIKMHFDVSSRNAFLIWNWIKMSINNLILLFKF